MLTIHTSRAATAATAALLALALASAPPARAASLADSIAALVPAGPVTVDVLTPQYSPEMQAIALKLDKARRDNPRFFQAWIARHPGGPPPWNPALGVTKDEYETYLREGRTANYTVRVRGTLTFERAGKARKWTLKGWGVLSAVDGLVIDLDAGRAQSPRAGVLPLVGSAAPNVEEVSLHWGWYAVWKAQHATGDPAKGGQALQASLHMGPLDQGRSTGLYWVMRRFNNGRRLDDEFLLLRWARGK